MLMVREDHSLLMLKYYSKNDLLIILLDI